MTVSHFAGKPAGPSMLVNVSKLITAYYTDLAGEKIQTILTHAPGNDASNGGLKVLADSGWFAACPSGTENIYKIYAESFRGADHLRRILEETPAIVSDTLAAAPQPEIRSESKLKGKP